MTTLYVLLLATLIAVCVLLIVDISMLNKVAKKVDNIMPVVITKEIEEPKKTGKKTRCTANTKRNAEPIPSRYGEIWEDAIDALPRRSREIAPIYKVSNMGRLWDTEKNAMVTPYMTKEGYSVSMISREGKPTSRLLKVLVATAFIGTRDTRKYKVVHCDDNIKNCAASNLRWAQKEWPHRRGRGW